MGKAASNVAMIGFGEAAMAFAPAILSSGARIRAYDIKTDWPTSAGAKRADYASAKVGGADFAGDAVQDAALVLSLVTADQALAAATSSAAALSPNAIFCDMNSVAPQTKAEAAMLIERAGGRYVDVAVMAPVHPAGTAAPLLVSGPHAAEAAVALRATGFSQIRPLDAPVGAASSIKMIRSVMIKGMEALSAECFLAAATAGVSDEVIASLDASWTQAGWAERGDYNLDRMLVHGLRRAAEMDEVEKTLQHLGLSGAMAAATAEWQRAIGTLGLAPPPGLAAKTAAILESRADAA